MTQEELERKVFNEVNSIKCKIELQYYLREKDRILNELNDIKDQLDILDSNHNEIDVFKYQKNRNRLLEANTIVEKYDNKTLSEDEKVKLIAAKEEKNELETWFNNQNETKENENKELLQILNKQEINKKDLLQINSLIKRFYEINPYINEVMDADNLLNQINDMELKYNTDDFNEEEYDNLKEDFIQQQQVVDNIIKVIKEYLDNSKNTYEEKKQEIESLKNSEDNKNALKNALNDLKIYEMDYCIWNESLIEAQKLIKEHTFIEKVEEIEEPEEIVEEIEPIQEENNKVQSIYDFYGIEKPEEIVNGYKQIKEPHIATFSKRFLNSLMMNTDFILSGDILLEGNVRLKFDEYENNEKEEETIISHNNNTIDILNNTNARDKISKTNKIIKDLIKGIQDNTIVVGDAINQINKLKEIIIANIKNITNKYDPLKDIIDIILIDSKKCDDISKLSLGKIENKEELKSLTPAELEVITMINQQDFEELVIQLINKKQFEKAIDEINDINLDLDEDNNKTK